MKTKILLSFAILVCASITANAQINKGRYLLGGSISYNHQSNVQGSDFKYNNFYSNVQLGKVVKDNAVVGILLSYGFADNSSNTKTNQYNAGVFYRKYKLLAKDFYFFGEVDGLYLHSQNESNFEIGNNGEKNTSNGGMISFVPGISYSVCKRMQVELSMINLASISYAGNKRQTTSSGTTSITTTTGNSFSVNANLNANLLSNFGIGFKFFLGK